jgi:BirA family biotin operon repressor/biotin-[acetyl-CoA-carboxylase] ligase
MRSAVATARAVRSFLPGDACGIKWPNDIVVDGRKIAGVLVERTAGLALVGIGINVGQDSFHADIDAHATSLARLGVHTDRLAMLDALTRSVDIAFQEPIESIYRTYCTLDRLTGHSCAFNTPAGSVTGMVRSVDPRLGIQVETASGVLFLPSATTSVVPAHAGSRYGGADVTR